MDLRAGQLIQGLSKELSTWPVHRIGLDLVHIARIEESLRAFPARFTQRFFTQGEIDYAESAPTQRAERYAARFAAKEAAIKALSLSEAGLDWRDVEVLRAADGACSLALRGEAEKAARAQRVGRVLVCLSHDGEYAAAVVAALSDTDEPGAVNRIPPHDDTHRLRSNDPPRPA
jgi:holo-[acyl-carrier protein] synthase